MMGTRRRLASELAAHPAWVLAGIVVSSSLVRFLLTRLHPGPWVFFDELVYSELAKGLAETGELRAREVPLSGFEPAYPLLLSIAYRLSDDIHSILAIGRGINALVMSLAAIPAYFLGRFLLGRGASLLAALFSVSLPSLIYTSTLMTENLFYPAFLLAVLAMLGVLARPTVARQLAALAAILAACLVRAQALVMLPALASAILLESWLAARDEDASLVSAACARRLGRYLVTWIGMLVLVAGPLLRHRLDAPDLAGRPLGLGDTILTADLLGGTARWFAIHLGELSLYVGIVPLAALFLLLARVLRRRACDSRERIFVAVSVCLLVWSVAMVSAFVEHFGLHVIKERYLFYLAPCLFVALLWQAGTEGRSAWRVPVALLACLPACLVPFGHFMGPSAIVEALALFPLWELQERSGVQGMGTWAGVSLAIAGGLLALFAANRSQLPARLLLGWFLVIQVPLYHRTSRCASETVAAGIGSNPTWIDDAVPAGATVAALWVGGNPNTLWETDFFNRSLGPVYSLQDPIGDVLPQERVSADFATGLLRNAARKVIEADYALVHAATELRGELIATNPSVRMNLYRVGGPVVVLHHVKGLYPDGWTRPEFWYLRLDCAFGILTLDLHTQFEGPQTIQARVEERLVAELTLSAGEPAGRLVVPLLKQPSGSCFARFTVTPGLVPADVLGTDDHRELGVFVDRITYSPSD